jgi:hypothetical protein
MGDGGLAAQSAAREGVSAQAAVEGCARAYRSAGWEPRRRWPT